MIYSAFRTRHCVWLAAIVVVAACSTVPVNLPSVTEQPTNKRLPGKIIWHDLLTDKPAESQRFYEELFGWEFERIGPDFGAIASANYTLIRHNGRLIGGMIDEARLDTTAEISQWIALMSTADIDAATSFYSDLAGLESGAQAVPGDSPYRYLASDDKPRFGVLPKPVEGLTPLWATYIRVDDPAAIVARVEELGGRVLLDTQARPLGGKVALIAGPSGAGIALQTWGPPEKRAENN